MNARSFIILLATIITHTVPSMAGQADYEVALVMQRWLHRTGDYGAPYDGKCSQSLLDALNRFDRREKESRIFDADIDLKTLCSEIVNIYMIAREFNRPALEESSYGFDIIERSKVDRIQANCRWRSATLVADAEFFAGALRSAVIGALQSLISGEFKEDDIDQLESYRCMLKHIS